MRESWEDGGRGQNDTNTERVNCFKSCQSIRVKLLWFLFSTGFRFNPSLYVSYERYAHLVAKWPPIFSPASITIPLILATAVNLARDLYFGEIDSRQWYKLYRLPFNRETIHGYIVTFIYEIISVSCVCVNYAINLSVFVGPILYLEAFCVDISTHFQKFDELRVQKLTKDDQRRIILHSFVEFINFHNDIIKWVLMVLRRNINY